MKLDKKPIIWAFLFCSRMRINIKSIVRLLNLNEKITFYLDFN